MFSGLTNQMSSLLSTVKGGSTDQEGVAAAATDGAEAPQVEQQQDIAAAAIQTDAAATELGESAVGDDKQSPTKVGGLFSGVKSQMSGWLPTVSMPTMSMPTMPAMPSIPGLRKHQEEGAPLSEEEAAAAAAAAAEAQVAEDAAAAGGGDDEDKSRYHGASATEGADSKPNTQPGTPTDEQAGQIGAVTTKVTQGVKSFGSFLYSSAHKAGEKIKKTVDSHEGILGQFNKDQDAFIKSQQGNAAGVAPWVGKPQEEQVKEEIMILSGDRRNFVRAPPAAVDFQFDYDVSYPVAQAIMAEDTALEKMRFELVPKIITEEQFWRNYFYRVSLICQAAELGTLGNDGSLVAQGSSEDALEGN